MTNKRWFGMLNLVQHLVLFDWNLVIDDYLELVIWLLEFN
jgi:hypothetical protein